MHLKMDMRPCHHSVKHHSGAATELVNSNTLSEKTQAQNTHTQC